ncbi:MAG: glutamine-hydrolyzing carbamoyl-phosphate synthase small subunit [Dehalococcoidia bacterium]|nr:glutamine-hydrolyzing carbamoyl-phosphate synthase small subunit [Dehalococcoidia bacterium]
MPDRAMLVLEDGSYYEGYRFGAEAVGHGEVVFNTGMTGYQEELTDPSYAGQIVVLTYPLIGNYGVNEEDFESKRIQVAGFVVREECRQPSHWQSIQTLHEFLLKYGVPGISGVDTRAITRRLRSAGVMMGLITSGESPSEALARLKALPKYEDVDLVKGVIAEAPYEWDAGSCGEAYHVVVLDCGLKYNILRNLRKMACRVTVVPCTMPAGEVLALEPDGVLISPGPGDPAHLQYVERTVQILVERKPVMGICMGHQLIGRAFGGRTYKLKFGHHGSNHPVRDLRSSRVSITSQNHGYTVDPDSLGGGLEVSHINLNDQTVEGFRHRELPLFCTQYHSEASPGPHDSVYLFKEFIELMGRERG